MTDDHFAASGVLAADQLERAFQRERARVERNEQCFSLAVFRMPACKTKGSMAELLARTAAVLTKRIRTYDDVGLVDDRSLAVLLPETTGEATWTFVDGALEELKLSDLTASCEVYTYPHPESREDSQVDTSTSGDRYGDYGRVEHPQDSPASASKESSEAVNASPVVSERSDGGDTSPLARRRSDRSSEGSASHLNGSTREITSEQAEDGAVSVSFLRHVEGDQAFGGGTLQSALNGTAVMERPTIRAIKDGAKSAAPRPRLRSVVASSEDSQADDLPTGNLPNRGLSNGSSAIASFRRPRPTTSVAPVKWNRTTEPSPDRVPETRPVRDLAPYFEERLPVYRRLSDILVAGSALTVLSPVLLTGALLVKLTSPGPIIFAQPRAGRGGRPFQFYKLRSMYRDAEERKNALRLVNEQDGPIFKIKNDPRITPVGKVLRKFSIDELPQLFNVLKGDMTLVGPRPPVLDEVKEYETWQRQRLDITGGITCIWQVSGRSDVTFREWMRMDVRYRKQRSLKLDMKLIWKTFGAVFSGKGAY